MIAATMMVPTAGAARAESAGTPATYEELLAAVARSDPRLMVMTAENRAAIRTLPERLGARFLDTGITEQTMIGMAAGLALCGRIPVVHALASFLTMRAYEFIRTDVGIARLPVKLVGGVAGVLSEANGPTHQAIEDVALMRTIPNMIVFCPSDTRELLAALPELLAHPDPVYIRYIDRPAVAHQDATPFSIGRARVLRDGADVALLTYGALLREAVDAVDQLAAAGVSTRLVDMRALSPIDRAAILAAADETRLVVTLEDHIGTGGLATIVAETLMAARFAAHVLPLSLGSGWFRPALLPDVLRSSGFTGEQIAGRVLQQLAHLTSL
jgi:transketolase